VNHSDVAPIEGSCSAIGLHLLIEPVTRPLASWNVVTPLLSVRAVPVVRPIGDDAEIAARLREHHVIDMWPWRQPLRRPEPLLGLARGCPVAIAELARASAMSRAMTSPFPSAFDLRRALRASLAKSLRALMTVPKLTLASLATLLTVASG
jgi:hypothetical protein